MTTRLPDQVHAQETWDEWQITLPPGALYGASEGVTFTWDGRKRYDGKSARQHAMFFWNEHCNVEGATFEHRTQARQPWRPVKL